MKRRYALGSPTPRRELLRTQGIGSTQKNPNIQRTLSAVFYGPSALSEHDPKTHPRNEYFMTKQDSPKTDEDAFWSFVESLIEHSNTASQTTDPGIISSALLYAAARFNAYQVAGTSEDRKALKEDKDEIISRLTGEYKKRFADHLEDYIENYKDYFVNAENT